jgi:hypothetical protein
MLLIVAAVAVRFLPVPRRRPRRPRPDLGAAARLLLIGLSAGLPLGGALEVVAAHVGPPLDVDFTTVLRQGRRHGLSAVLADAPPTVRRFTLRLARAQLTGAPLAATVAAFVAEERSERRARTLTRLNRLPVALTVPLALLILPGFVLLTLGPTVAGVVVDLFGAVL